MNATSSKDETTVSHIQQAFKPSDDPESPSIQAVVSRLNLSPHIEGGYFRVTDVSPHTMPSPYPPTPLSEETLALAGVSGADTDVSVRLTSTTIFYYLTPNRPQGTFHVNRSRIIHTLHHGRGRYVLIHPDGRLETFVVGSNIEAGERLSWVVEGGVWKASFLLPSEGEETDAADTGLLISETVVPGFDYNDHEFLSPEVFKTLLPETTTAKLEWLVKAHEDKASTAQTEPDTETLESGGSVTSNLNPRLSQVLS